MKNVLLVQTSPPGKECSVYVKVQLKLYMRTIYLADFRELTCVRSLLGHQLTLWIKLSSSYNIYLAVLNDEKILESNWLIYFQH